MTATPQYVTTAGADQLSATARDHLWMHFTRHSTYEDGATCRSSCAARAPTSTTPGQALPRRARRAVRRQARARPRPSSPRRPPSRPTSWRSSRCGPTPTPPRSTLAERVADYAPGDLNRVFFTTGGGEAVETAWKLAKNYFKLTGKPMKHKVISRAIAYHGTTQGALSITGLPRREDAVRAAGARRAPGAEHQLLPRARSTATTSRRSAAGPPTRSTSPSRSRAPTPSPRSSSSRCRTPAAASRRRPATSQRVREICDEHDVLLVVRRGDLRLRPARRHVRLRPLRLPARHDHLRQGHHLRLLPASAR